MAKRWYVVEFEEIMSDGRKRHVKEPILAGSERAAQSSILRRKNTGIVWPARPIPSPETIWN